MPPLYVRAGFMKHAYPSMSLYAYTTKCHAYTMAVAIPYVRRAYLIRHSPLKP